MSRVKKDTIREHRIDMEIIVDAYHEEERAMGWYYYLEDNLAFPCKAKCTAKRSISPLKTGEIVEVTGMAPEEECMHEMFVEIQWEKQELAVPLSQLKGISVNDETKQAIEDWHYWVSMGYQF
ncbi:MAG: calcium-binding protein [Candidatus Jettenia caeni]|nr:MAG: calcium-binding protein [Candidatus Jettenia caeni]